MANGNGNEQTIDKLKENDELLEQKQYMGDYYLHMRFYEIAIKYLTHVMLNRYIKFGILDNITLDSFIRLYIAVFAHQDYQMSEEMVHYFDVELWQKNDMEALKKISNGLADKIECLKGIIEISQNGQNDNEEIIQCMLAEIDQPELFTPV